MEYPAADRFLRELLLYRYHQFIQTMEAKFSLTKEQVSLLQEQILTVHWLTIN
jgi:hypothetical protein